MIPTSMQHLILEHVSPIWQTTKSGSGGMKRILLLHSGAVIDVKYNDKMTQRQQ